MKENPQHYWEAAHCSNELNEYFKMSSLSRWPTYNQLFKSTDYTMMDSLWIISQHAGGLRKTTAYIF